MKTLDKLKLNTLNNNYLEDRQMNALRGGGDCYCSCYWYGNGGSSSVDNRDANYSKSDMTYTKVYSAQGCNQYWAGGCGTAECYGCNETKSGNTSGWS